MLEPGAAEPGDADFAAAMALLARGVLGRMLLVGVDLPPQSVAAASAAALLDGEPSLALRPTRRVMRLVAAAALISLGRSRRRADAAQLPPAGTGEIRPPAPPLVAMRASAKAAPLSSEIGISGVGAGESSSGADASSGADVSALAAGIRRPASDADAGASGAANPVSAERSGVATEFGGLPFLLHLVERCDIPERATRGELADAGLVQVLCAIGTRILERLLGAGAVPDPEDAALACLCGRTPIAGWRSALDAVELPAAVGQLADGEAERLIAALRAALEPSKLAAAPEGELLAAVCRRRGRVVADPGWIDVCLDLVEVSTDVRRAGLDLDLGYRPWLGCVVRFVYG
jgi:hypothetical protein